MTLAARLGCTDRQLDAVAHVEGSISGEALLSFARFVEQHALRAALAQIDDDPDNCREFACGYNGTDYEARRYHERLAAAYRKGGRE